MSVCFVRRPSDPVCRPAFTLIELLVAIVVIAILMSITLPLSRYAIHRANEARREVMQAKIRSALEEYRATYGEYPITPLANDSDVNRHYSPDYMTYDPVKDKTNKVFLGTNTVETLYDIHSNPFLVDYCLTYPLMFKQLEKGARPFMEFPIVDVVYMATKGGVENEVKWQVWRRTKGGGKKPKTLLGLYGDAVKRARAIDPLSGQEWKYVCTNGLNYQLTP